MSTQSMRCTAEEQLLEDEPRLDGLAEPNIVGNEEVGPRELDAFIRGVSW